MDEEMSDTPRTDKEAATLMWHGSTEFVTADLARRLEESEKRNQELVKQYKFINPCALRSVSSRVCELGTKSCVVEHFKSNRGE